MPRLLVVLILAALASPLHAGPSPFGSPDTTGAAATGSPFKPEIEAAPSPGGAGDTTELRVLLRIPPGHWLYAERTRLEVIPAPGVEVLDVQGPAGETKHDPFLEEDVQVLKHDALFVARLRVQSAAKLRAVMHSHGCSPKFCFFPQSDTLVVDVAWSGKTPAAAGATQAGTPSANDVSPATARLRAAAGRGLLWLLLLAFGAGVATSFTPCVYPMIPITIGIIGARSAGRRSKGFTLSLLYVLGIAVTYSALGTSAALTGSLFGSILQNRWVVTGVAAIFVLMAMSLFGAFELQVPSAFAGRMNRVQGSGYPGAFVLGLVAGIVASPCIGPVLVAMLAYVAASGSPLLGFALFFAFALGLGLLFVVLGTFTGVLASLPRSGAWMGRVRIAFGLLFLALAIYYLHPLLPHGRELLPVGLVLLALGLVLGALRHIEETERAGLRWRKALGRAALVGGLYAAVVPFVIREHAAALPGPRWLTSEPSGLEQARAAGRPMLIDFAAEWCAACKELERLTFSDRRVIERAEAFVTVRVDATRSTPEIDRLMAKYGIRGLPWVAFVDPDGTIRRDLTVTGFIDAEKMLSRMAKAAPARADSPAAY
jgi:thiol:disulfide interchange protein DsbD